MPRDLAPGESVEFSLPLSFVGEKGLTLTARCSKCGGKLEFFFELKKPEDLKSCEITCVCGTEYKFQLASELIYQGATDEPRRLPIHGWSRIYTWLRNFYPRKW